MKSVLSFVLGAVITFLAMSYAHRAQATAPVVQARIAQDTRPFDPAKEAHPIGKAFDPKVDFHPTQQATAKKYDFSDPNNFPLANPPCAGDTNKKSK